MHRAGCGEVVPQGIHVVLIGDVGDESIDAGLSGKVSQAISATCDSDHLPAVGGEQAGG